MGLPEEGHGSRTTRLYQTKLLCALLGRSEMLGSYWDLDDVLASNERIPCRAESVGKGLGWLELGGRTKQADLQIGTEMELPYWLASSLLGYVAMLLPVPYRQKWRAHLVADPTTVQLPAYYFHIGLSLAALHQDRELQELLRASFAQRYKLILDRSYNMRIEDPSATEKLTAVEHQLYTTGSRTAAEFARWQVRQVSQLRESQEISSVKRKRDSTQV